MAMRATRGCCRDRQPWLPAALSWSVWGVAATYYLAAFYLRSSPAVMTTELMRDFGISASQLGQFLRRVFLRLHRDADSDRRAGRLVGRAAAADRGIARGRGGHLPVRRDEQLRARLGRTR